MIWSYVREWAGYARYWIRPYDMHRESERRWFWQRRAGCFWYDR